MSKRLCVQAPPFQLDGHWRYATQAEIDAETSVHLRQSWDNLKIANRNGQALLDAARLVSSVMHRHDTEQDYFWDALDALDAAIELSEKSSEISTEEAK